jgi:CBS domain-containing protein
MHVRDILGQKRLNLITVDVDGDIESAVHLLILHNIGGLPVRGHDGSVVGFIAERDVVRAVEQHGNAVRNVEVRTMMRPPPTCQAGESLQEVMRRMTIERQRHLVVEDKGQAIGVVSVGDIVKHRLEQLETETGVLRDYLAGQRAGR